MSIRAVYDQDGSWHIEIARSDAIAVRDRLNSLTYNDLAQAARIRSEEFGSKRQLILVEADLSIESVITIVAALVGGNAIILADPAQAKTNDQLAETFGVNRIVDCYGKARGSIRPVESGALHPDLGVLLSTSGSTGSAKLVRLSLENILSNAKSIVEYLNLQSQDVGALTLPLHYSYGLSILTSHLTAGASLYLCDRPVTEPGWLDEIYAANVTNISGVPFSYEVFERTGFRDKDWPDLRFMTAAGGRLPPEIVHRYAEFMSARSGEFFVMYGQTEAAPRIAYLPPEAALQNPDCIGLPVPGGEIELIDDGKKVRENLTAGELVYRGPNVMMGYAETAKDLCAEKTCFELHTGDIAERTQAGYFRIVGRSSRFSKIAGLRISHDEIERQMSAIGISTAVTGDDNRIVVAIENAHSVEDPIGLVAKIAHINPSSIAVLRPETMPRLANGKVDYAALNRMALLDERRESETVKGAFERAFWPESVSNTDSFVSLGGDSLRYLALTLDLERMISEMPVNWERKTVSELEKLRISGNSGLKRPASTRLQRIEAHILIRVFAILAIVIGHLTKFEFLGGSLILMMLVGYSLARFQREALSSGRVMNILWPLGRNLVGYYVVLAFFAALLHPPSIAEYFLVANLVPDGSPPILDNTYWFIEAYAQILLAAVLFSLFPNFRRWIRDKPLLLGIISLGAAFVFFQIDLQIILHPPEWSACHEGPCYTVFDVGVWAAIGWCLGVAQTMVERTLSVALSIIVASSAFYLDGTELLVHSLVFAAIIIAIALRTSLRLSPSAARFFTFVAANSYSIYLFHMLPAELVWWNGEYFPLEIVGARNDPRFFGSVIFLCLGISSSFLLAWFGREIIQIARQQVSRKKIKPFARRTVGENRKAGGEQKGGLH